MTIAEVVAEVATGVALLAAGAVTWTRARDSRTGPLLTLAGVAWLAGTIASALVYAHRGPLVHTLLTYPSGRTRRAPIVAVIAFACGAEALYLAEPGLLLVAAAVTAVLGRVLAK